MGGLEEAAAAAEGRGGDEGAESAGCSGSCEVS